MVLADRFLNIDNTAFKRRITSITREGCHGNTFAHRSRHETQGPSLSEVRREDQFAADPLQAVPRKAAPTEEKVIWQGSDLRGQGPALEMAAPSSCADP